jgi:hypothetical protein
MVDALWAFFFGGQVEQQVVVVNSATLSDAYDYRRRFYAETDGPTQQTRSHRRVDCKAWIRPLARIETRRSLFHHPASCAKSLSRPLA